MTAGTRGKQMVAMLGRMLPAVLPTKGLRSDRGRCD